MCKLLLPSLLLSPQVSPKGPNPEHYSQLLTNFIGIFPAKKKKTSLNVLQGLQDSI